MNFVHKIVKLNGALTGLTLWGLLSKFWVCLCHIQRAFLPHSPVCEVSPYPEMSLKDSFRKSARVLQSCEISEAFDGDRPQAKVTIHFWLAEDVLNKLRDILTRGSFLNAIAIINVIGGSTNAVGVLAFDRTHLNLDHPGSPPARYG